MGDQTSEVEDLERIFTDTSAEPIKISYAAIKYITKNFAIEIGDGGFGVVYLGGLQNGMVAVKKLFHSKDLSDKQFLDEVICLKKVNHRNIVRFLGYCADTEGEIMEVEGKHRIVEVQKRLLCFEYVPNGNLHRYIKEETHGYEWNVRYKIIQGICQGLHYIHQERINHLDLKPANVLLGANMEPKITDFCVSRCISGEQCTMITKNFFGTLGYVAPEFIDKQQISFKSDIYSLGVIMTNLLSGHNGCIPEKGGLQNRMVAVKNLFHSKDLSDKQFLDEVICLKKVNHHNIVRFLGYCADTEGEIMEIEGKHRIVEVQKRLLCFEYVPNGNLHHYIKEKTHGYEWNVRYKIIQGICQGLHYIHQERINHLDLKPANVLLGANMEPKITDFGVSRCISEEQGTMVTKNFFGTLGYIAPEFIDKQQISFKSDIFSLGVIIINLLSGHNGCIPEKWHESIDAPCPQMKRCIEIAQRCVDTDPHKRPTAGEIIHYLKETEILIEKDSPTIDEPRNDPGSSLHQVVQRFRALPIETLREHSRLDTLFAELHVPECLHEGSKKPGRVPLHLLQFITENFSHKREIGRTEFARLFWGNLQKWSIAVKRLSMTIEFDDRIFINEVKAMMLVQHKNIAQFLGYCSNTEEEVREYQGELIMVHIRERLLCFEYLSNGSLDRYFSDASCGLEWRLRYQIIKGICEGLHYLHGKHIVHMHLKSRNILLADNMVPKIADLCLSRFFAEGQSQNVKRKKTVTAKKIGTRKYMAPQSLCDGDVSYKSDICSLGVIITEILTGRKEKFANGNLLESWKNRLLRTSSADLTLLEQVRVCAEISRACTADDPDERPDTGRIIEMLLETETDGAGTLYWELNVMECILKGTKKPTILSHQLLLFITGNFSHEQEIGRSEFAITYRGILLHPRVAVKRLSTTKEFDDQLFSNEINTLILVQHKNIVQFLGTCSYTQEEAREYQGELIMPDTRERLLCFEYLSNGSLKDYVSDASRGLEWRLRYQIIKGICEGLHYIHGKKIVHGELRLTNVLLDDNMVPKIADFCLSRCFVEHQRRAIMPNKIGSMGYMAPEVFAGCITFMSDIYSLGIIIAEILTGRKDIAKENVLESWRTRLDTSSANILLEQVRVCAEISIACINPNPERRPDMQHIIEMLGETEC